MASTSSVTPESFFALREPDGAQISLQEHIYGRPSDSVTRRVLLAMTALAFICERRPTNESYAAALYTSTDGSGENPTVLLSGVGPIPDATMDFVQTAILPQLRRRSRDRTWSTPKDYTAALRELFTTIALFTSERLRERAHCGDKDTWQHRVDRTRAWISADYLETFNLLVSKLDELKKFASVLEQTRGTERAEPVQYVLFFLSVELDRFLVEERTRLMLSLVDSGIRGAGDVSQIVKSRTPTLDATQCVEDGDGGLIKDFSFAHFALNLIATYRSATSLFNLVELRPDYFHGDSPQIVFCPSVSRTVAIDATRANFDICHGHPQRDGFMADERASITGYPHAVVNLLENLVAASSRGVDIKPAIGCSSLLCKGCSVCIDVYNEAVGTVRTQHPHEIPMYLPTEPPKFGYVGTTGRVVFPWFSPDLHAIDEELHERVQQSIGSRIRRELDSVLRDREDQLYWAREAPRLHERVLAAKQVLREMGVL